MAEEGSNSATGMEPLLIPGSQFFRALDLPPTLCTKSTNFIFSMTIALPRSKNADNLLCIGFDSSQGNSIHSMVAVDGGKYLWACCNEGTIIVWDARTGSVLATRQAHKATIFELICVSNASNPFAKDSCTVWAACMDSTVTLWNPSLSLIRKLSLASSSATALVQVNNMVFIADAKQIFVFDAYTYDLIQTVDLPTIDYLSSSDCNSTNSALEEIHRAPTVMKLDRNQLGTVMGRPAAVSSTEPWIGYFVRCMAQVGDFVWVCTDGFVCFVDIATLTVVPNVHIPIPKINTLAYIKSTNQVWGGCSDCSIYVWDAASPSSTGKIQPLRHITGWSSDRVSKLVNWDDKYVYSGSWDKRLRVWDAQTATMLCESKKVHECPIMSIVVLPYRWLRIVPPKSNDSPPNTTPAEPRREAQSLPPKLPSAESLVLPRVNSTEAQMSNTGHQTNQEVEAETTTIMTVLTADWSSVSLWV